MMLKRIFLIACCLLPISACQGEPEIAQANSPFSITVKPVLESSIIPWGMDWLPNGEMVITSRAGELFLFNEQTNRTSKIEGLPPIVVNGQGGLLDVHAHPNFADNGWLYFTYAKADTKGNSSTALARAQLKANQLINWQDLYVAEAYDDSGHHYGSRIAFDNDNFVYFSIGDRGDRDNNPQDVTRDGGKIYRLHDDGRLPEDNPLVNAANSKTAIYSWGHRNPQGLARHPVSGRIWAHEHGPRGGDELNLISKGQNYGWPLVSHGVNYSGTSFTDLTEKAGMVSPIWHWTPSIAPSGMVFVTSERYPSWQGSVLVGSLKFGYLVILTLDNDKVTEQSIVVEDLTRVRNVKQGPNGFIYVAIDGQGIVKLLPN